MRKRKSDTRSTSRTEASFRLLLVAWLLASPVTPATITVDEAACTLIDAIESANTNAAVGGCPSGDQGADTIELTTNVLLEEVNNSEYGPTGLPVVRSEILIRGGGHRIDAEQPKSFCGDIADCFRILAVAPGGDSTLTLRNTTITGGEIEGDGAGVLLGEGATLHLLSSRVRSNRMARSSGNGAGIWAGANSTVVLESSQIAYNDGGSQGGGVFVGSNATLVVDRSRIGGNYADYGRSNGGGIFADTGSSVVITNSLIDDNHTDSYPVDGSGGGIFFKGEMLAVRGSTIIDNHAYQLGGGIYILPGSTAVISNTTISGNIGRERGGGIAVNGELRLIDSTVSENKTDFSDFSRPGGGGIRASGSSRVTLMNTTLVGNESIRGDSQDRGGGLLADEFSDVTVINSTFSNNYTDGDGGGIHVRDDARVTVLHSTLVNNAAKDGGANFRSAVVPGGARVLSSVIVGGDCLGTISDGDNNFTDSPGCPGSPIVSGVDIDPTLTNNGGPTETHALLPGSVAINGGTDCPLETDQRRFARDDRICDSGSFEFGGGPPSLTLTAFGDCPGVLTVVLSAVTPGGSARLFRANAEGIFTLPMGGPCESVELGLDDPDTLTTNVADAQGEFSATFTLADAACGLYLQAIDATTCVVSGVIQLP